MRFAAFDLVLNCLLMSHKKDAGRIWVKTQIWIKHGHFVAPWNFTKENYH